MKFLITLLIFTVLFTGTIIIKLYSPKTLYATLSDGTEDNKVEGVIESFPIFYKFEDGDGYLVPFKRSFQFVIFPTKALIEIDAR